ncbi:cation transport ATPase [Streptomyces gancidicus BKS 13-15]|uniref:Cation transport ATPase n=1 Tax=Streptomyces gancidicus BKS 13-15 TaxID=1284664 RepID=M3E127_STREZ|nr:cation transport ATPase [Streptomyces gancidicus BKS 13-15]
MERLAPGRVEPRDGAQQSVRVGVGGVGEQLAAPGGLHDLARVEHVDLVAESRDHAEVVGDHQQGGALLVHELLEQLQDLRLDGHVEGRGGLVGDEQARGAGDRHGDERALAHAAGELVRVLLEPPGRVGDADPVQQVGGLLAGGLPLHPAVTLQDLGDLHADRDDRVQRGQRVLEDHRHLAAAQVAARGRVHREQVRAVELGTAADGETLRGQQAHQGQGGHGLAAAGLADQAHDLALVDLEGDAVDRPGLLAAAAAEGDGQFVDSEQRHGGSAPQLRVEGFPHGLAEEGEAEGGDDDADGGVDRHRGGVAEEALRLGEHDAPLGDRRVGVAEPQVGQGGRLDDRGGQGERGLHDHRAERVGQDLREHDAALAHTQGLGREDVVRAALGQHRAAQQAGEHRHLHHTHGDHHRGQRLPHDGGDGDRQQQRRQRQHHVDEAHDDGVDAPSGVAAEGGRGAGDDADHEAGDQADQRGDDADEQGLPGADEHPGEQVAAEVVEAEPVAVAGPDELALVGEDLAAPGLRARRVGREERPDDRDEHEQDDDDGADDGHLAGLQPAEGLPPEAGAGAGLADGRQFRETLDLLGLGGDSHVSAPALSGR